MFPWVLLASFAVTPYHHNIVDSVGWAFVDTETISEEEWLTTRYVYIPHWASNPIEWHAAVSFTMNSLGTSRAAVIPEGVAEGWLVRCNLALYFPEKVSLKRALNTWDRLSVRGARLCIFDAEKPISKRVPIAIPPLLYSDNGLDQLWANLKDRLVTPCPIVSADHLISWSLDTEDDGLYYEWFLGANERTEQAIMQRFAGVNVAHLRKFLGQGRAVCDSQVTGKRRRIDAGTGIGKHSQGSRWSTTHDISDKDEWQDANRDAFLNPLRFNDRARESLIFDGVRQRGFLYNDAGVLQNEVPPDVASDITSPGRTKRLCGFDACIRCHGPESGYRRFKNIYPGLWNSGLTILDDLKASEPEIAQDLIASLYSQEMDSAEGFFGRLRRDYDTAVKGYTGYNVQEMSSILSQICREYKNDHVTTKRAIRELGWDAPVKEEQAQKYFQIIMGQSQELHPYLLTLGRGLSLPRPYWARVYGDAITLSWNKRTEVVQDVPVEE